MRFLYATLAFLALTSINAVSIQKSSSSAFSRLAADVHSNTETHKSNINTDTNTNTNVNTNANTNANAETHALPSNLFSDLDPSVLGPITSICPGPNCPILISKPDLIPYLTISDDGYSIVYPPNSIGVKNIGTATSQPCVAKLSCIVWSNTFPPTIIPGGVVYDENLNPHGLCFSDVTVKIPSIPAGGSHYVSVPFNAPISCRKPAGRCDVHWKVDITGTNPESNESNNEIIRYKKNIASNPPWWP